MMKKLLSFVLILGMVFVFSACEQQDNSYDGSESYDTEENVEEYEDSENTLDLYSRGTWVVEDTKGYKVQGEIKTTDLIRASNWGVVEDTFNSLSSSDPLPSFDTVAPEGANQETSSVLVGKIVLDNITDGWDFSESSPYECSVYLDAPDLYGENASSLCVMYGTGLKKYDFGGVRGTLDTTTVMVSNHGAILFIIVIPETFTPNEPNGSANVLNSVLRVRGGADGCEFTMPGLAE